MKTVSVALLPSLIDQDYLPGSFAIVIDVLRATSVIATALAGGARRIVTCNSIDEAHSLKQSLDPGALLCGERGGLPIPGFDLSNSPTEYTPAIVSGKTLVLTTTNGTKALAALDAADTVVTASFLNVSAVLAEATKSERVLVVCAGTNGQITGEDVLLAGAITKELTQQSTFEPANDQAHLARSHWQQSVGDLQNFEELTAALHQTLGGRNLKKIGFDDDVPRVAKVDTHNVVPTRKSRSPIELGL